MSALSFRALRDADLDPLSAAAEAWRRLWRDLEEHAGNLDEDIKNEIGDEHFRGITADSARAWLTGLTGDVDVAAAEALLIHGVLDDAHAGLDERQTQLIATVEAAVSARFAVKDDGTVKDHLPMGGAEAAADSERREVQRGDYEATLAFIVDEARTVDDNAAARLAALRGGADDATVAAMVADLVGELPGPDASPEEVNAWWNDLSSTEQSLLIKLDPDFVGGTDGIPAATRDDANHIRLDREEAAIEAELAAIEAEMAELKGPWNDYLDGGDVSDSELIAAADEAGGRIEELYNRQVELQTRLDNINSLDAALAEGYELPDGERRDYLLIDYNSAADGKAIIATGDPDQADNTAVYVPGTTADLGGVNGLLDRVDAMAYDADKYGDGQDTSVMLWLDYDAPDDVVPDAAFDSYAENAASDLSGFTDSLRATHEGSTPANTTLVGHSYGTTVIGVTARDEGVNVDNMILVASPGVEVDHASDLGIDPANVYATKSHGDEIDQTRVGHWTDEAEEVAGNTPGFSGILDGIDSLAGEDTMVHGRDPTSRDFGANTFASAPGGHSDYWSERNRSGRMSMALIITGQ